MCRLFGMSAGDHRVKATFWLLDDTNSLAKQSQENPDGAGLGWFDENGHPKIDKQPIAAYEDAEFHRAARERQSSNFVAHVRHATGTPHTLENTHPFMMDGRIFAHNGEIGELDKVDAELGDARALVKGQTDSERIFALITKKIREGSEPGDAIVAAAKWLGENVPVISINLILATSTDMWALRYPEADELWMVRREADGAPVTHHSSEGTRVHSQDLAGAPSVILASEKMDGGQGWRLLPSGTLVHIAHDLTVSEKLALLDAPKRAMKVTK